MTKIYHLDSGPMKPYWPKITGVTYVLLVETNQGWLLVDSGFGTQDFLHPSFFMKWFLKLLRVPNDPSFCVVNQISKYGLKTEDINHIVLTHLHLDHAGGLPDFPNAQVHLDRKEWDAAKKRKGLLGLACLPYHWAHQPNWQLYENADTNWFGFPAIRLNGITPEILLIPTPGHTLGHCMVVIKTDQGWLLNCGDACYPFYLSESEQYISPPQKLVQLILGNHQPKIADLLKKHGDEIEILTSHDPVTWAKHQK